MISAESPSRTIDGRYRLDRVLGEGGMGCVWEATQLDVDRRVALKELLPSKMETEQSRARFQREAMALAALRHPHVVQLLDFGRTEEGGAFLVMELAGGQTLADIIERESPLAPARVRHLGAQLASALRAAHDAGLVHRDIKPSNIMVDRLDGAEYVRLLDFGIAKSFMGIGAAGVGVTATQDIIGSPRYMSPEQAQGQPVTPASDAYSFGLVLYEMLTGHPVFDAETAGALIVAHATGEVRRPTNCDDDGLVDLTLWCLAKAPWDRPTNGGVLVDAFAGRAMPPAHAPAAEVQEPLAADAEPAKPPNRRSWWLAAAAFGLLATGALGVLVSNGDTAVEQTPPKPIAEDRRKTPPPPGDTAQPKAPAQPLEAEQSPGEQPAATAPEAPTQPAAQERPTPAPVAAPTPAREKAKTVVARKKSKLRAAPKRGVAAPKKEKSPAEGKKRFEYLD